MRGRLALFVALSAGLFAAGCGGPDRFQTRGRLLKGGAPLVPGPDEAVRVMFVPLPEGGERVTDFHMAAFNREDGTFRAAGKDGRGVPPGRYRIAVEYLRHRNDVLKGAFDSDRSPFTCEVNGREGELVLDLDKPH